MSVLRVSGPVRRRMGRNADALSAGVGLPIEAQCWACGDTINLLAARPGSVTLSVVSVGSADITTFGHAEHTTSRLFTAEEYEAEASSKPSPVGRHEEILVDGRPVDEAVVIVDDRPAGPGKSTHEAAVPEPVPDDDEEPVLRENPGLGDYLRALAREVHAAGSDEEALRIMRDATGLTITDPDADRATIDARVAAAHEARKNRASGAKIYTVRCPSCGQLPDLIVNPGQAFCGNDFCEAFQFAPDQDAFEQLANRTEMGPIVGPGRIDEGLAASVFARRPVQVAGSAEDDVREAEIRSLFHGWGYTCADPNGSCAVCDWHPDRMNDGE